MDNYQFYKSLYDRELSRRIDLESSVNLPLTILSIVVASNGYIVKEDNLSILSWQQILQTILLIIVTLIVGISIFYLTRSYNNLFKGFAYRNFGLTTEIRKYEKELIDYNKKVDEESKVSFESIILDKLIAITEDNIIFNDKRSYDLYLAKTFLIVGIILTVINFVIFSLKYIKI